MKRQSLATIFALTLAGVCLIAAAFFSCLYYTLYQHSSTDLQSHINSLEWRMTQMQKSGRELHPVHAWGVVSTVDRPRDEHLHFYDSSEIHPEGYFELINAKGGPVIRPELRMPLAVVNDSEYEIHIEGQFGHVVDAWLSNADSFQDLAKFTDFRVLVRPESNTVKVVARPKPGESIQMKFRIVVLCAK